MREEEGKARAMRFDKTKKSPSQSPLGLFYVLLLSSACLFRMSSCSRLFSSLTPASSSSLLNDANHELSLTETNQYARLFRSYHGFGRPLFIHPSHSTENKATQDHDLAQLFRRLLQAQRPNEAAPSRNERSASRQQQPEVAFQWHESDERSHADQFSYF